MSQDTCISRRGAIASASLVAASTALAVAGRAYGEDFSQASPLSASDAISFLYIDNAQLLAGAEQNVVISLAQHTGVTAAVLTVQDEAGAEQTCSVTTVQDSALLFTYVPSGMGSCNVSRLQFYAGGSAYVIDFSDVDASFRSYTVMPMARAYSAGEADDPDLHVYTGDGGDELAESTSIEEAASAAMALTAAPMALSDTKEGPLVVALDPGHVGVSSGAVANGTKEASATWKIAQYCKAELETYENVSVVYTVTEGENLAYPDNELAERVRRAVNQGADVLVSLHLNTSNGAGHGAEVWAPHDASYNYSTHEVGVDLGNKILSQLESLGLTNRMVKFRVIDDDNSYNYADGSHGDYYGIIRNARNANLPAIIVEHAFLDNGSDYQNYLSSDAKLQSLGIADAAGIADYFGLTRPVGTVYRLYYEGTKDHHYTMDYNEYVTLGRRGWTQEGVAWKSPESSGVPVYRLYHEGTKDHHYTMDAWEYKVLGQRGWTQEGIAWYSDEAQAVPVYRLYYEGTKDHHYTMDAWEYKVLGQRGWTQEGIAWYSLE